MDKTDQIKIAIVTGSTGGHNFPGHAIGEQLRNKNNVDIYFFVPHKNYIQKWLKKKEFSFVTIPYARLSYKDIFSPLKFIYVFFRAFLHLVHKRFKAIIITGSYTTVPYLLASKLLGIKIFVHEQNYKMGKVT